MPAEPPVSQPPLAAEVNRAWPNKADRWHVLRGMCMGGADVIPGVSGGTIALILGIYERLVAAISSANTEVLADLKQRRWKDAAAKMDVALLLPLGIGIVLGAATLGSVMNVLLENYLQYTNAVFFGLIAASTVVVARMIERWTIFVGVLVLTGAAFAIWLVRQPALATPPDGLWYVFLCGTVAICAMILPGISGAFVLLILGKYHDITELIKSLVKGEIALAHVLTVATFTIGCVCGLLAFTRVLRWLLAHYHARTLGALCGFMLGSLWKIWPFQREVTEGHAESFKERVFVPRSLADVPIDGRFWLTVGLALLAAVAILVLDALGRRMESARSDDSVASDDEAG